MTLVASPLRCRWLFGGILGSFLNVVVYRLPRGESLSHPGSRCPACDTPIRPYDNVPVLSWLILRGAAATAAYGSPGAIRSSRPAPARCAALVVARLRGRRRTLWLGLVLVLLLVPITLIDLDHQIIPNKLDALGGVGAVAILAALDPGALPST